MKKCLFTIAITLFVSFYSYSQVQIMPSGDVGIGTDSATTKLDVAGELRVRNLNQNNNADSVLVVTGNGTFEYRSAATLGSGSCTYAIGDIAFGGIIFYLDGSGCHGLVADTTNLGAYKWDTGGSLNTYAFADWANGGKINTDRIITVYGASNVPAANACQNSTAQGFTDWYLPSKLELNMMFVNLHLQGLGSFANLTYWCSTELSTTKGTIQDFFDGFQDSSFKSGTYDVRAVRSF